jgi:hypothetical protein
MELISVPIFFEQRKQNRPPHNHYGKRFWMPLRHFAARRKQPDLGARFDHVSEREGRINTRCFSFHASFLPMPEKSTVRSRNTCLSRHDHFSGMIETVKACRSVRLYAGTNRPPLRGVVVAVVVEQGRQKGATGRKTASCVRATAKKPGVCANQRKIMWTVRRRMEHPTIATATNINKLSGF